MNGGDRSLGKRIGFRCWVGHRNPVQQLASSHNLHVMAEHLSSQCERKSTNVGSVMYYITCLLCQTDIPTAISR